MRTAIATYHPSAEYVTRVGWVLYVFACPPGGALQLYPLEGFMINDRRMRVFRIVLRQLTMVANLLFGQMILAIGFLQQRIARILLIHQHFPDRR